MVKLNESDVLFIRNNKDIMSNKEFSIYFNKKVSDIENFKFKHKIKGDRNKIFDLKNDIHLDEEEYQIIIGSLLGDATLSINKKNKGRNAHFQETHSIKQEKYLLWKKDYALSKFRVNTKFYPEDKKHSAKLSLWTQSSPTLTDIYNKLYVNGKKSISKEILKSLNPLGIAVWFMDDGTLNLNGGGDLSTDGFNKDENTIIKDYFNKIGVECRIFKRVSGTYKIIFSNIGFSKLINIISNYIHPKLFYKIDLNRQKEYHKLYYQRHRDDILKMSNERYIRSKSEVT